MSHARASNQRQKRHRPPRVQSFTMQCNLFMKMQKNVEEKDVLKRFSTLAADWHDFIELGE